MLIVDNDAAHAAAVAESLERVGYDCTVATSGTEGAARIERELFDIVITDLVMNDVDGLEILATGQGEPARGRSDPGHRPRHRPLGRGRHAAGGLSTICSSRSIWGNCGR